MEIPHDVTREELIAMFMDGRIKTIDIINLVIELQNR